MSIDVYTANPMAHLDFRVAGGGRHSGGLHSHVDVYTGPLNKEYVDSQSFQSGGGETSRWQGEEPY